MVHYLDGHAYTYDGEGNKLSMTEEDGGVTSYQYDAVYRLIRVDYPERPDQKVVTAKNNGSHQGKGKKNGHAKVEPPLPSSVSYAYDAAGNRISERDGAGSRKYQYNADNFLVRFADPEDQVTEYGYDAVNRRAFKNAGKNDIASYLYDGLEVLQEVSGQNAQKIAAYYRANGRIVSQQKYNVSQGNNEAYQHRPEGRQQFYAYDGLGSVAALSNHQGQQQTRYHYDAFGKVIDGDLTENQYTFTGRQLDPESGLYHFHFRQYDPTSGVWTTADPIGIFGGVNLYTYAGNNPVNWIDFLGLVCGKNQNTSNVGGFQSLSSYFGTSMFGFSGEYPSVGRRGIWGFEPGGLICTIVETLAPAGHNFGKVHDALVGYLVDKVGMPDWLVNIPTMPPAFAFSVAGTLLSGIWDYGKLVGNLVESFSKGPGAIGNAISSIGDKIENTVEAIGGAITDAVSAIGRTIGIGGTGDSDSSGSGVGGVSGADMGKGSESW